ncbi:unnamed protein product [Adineta steineri]|uniref:Uncharacterized protein n=1 Tax=Adineta steineri TaxID=433720 RepID=A0A814SPX5_9BILA|nr:unnamed protein product [Adineta steineri]CAF3772866.1 unnamed protein product [Adineta steineri]
MLSLLCQLVSSIIDDELINFYSTSLVTENVIPRIAWNAIVNASSDQFWSSTASSFKTLLNSLKAIIQGNVIVNSLETNWQIVTFVSYGRLINLLTSQSHVVYHNCSCEFNSRCKTTTGIYKVYRQNETDIPEYWENTVKLVQGHLEFEVEGINVGCLNLDAVLQSNLSCLYNASCLIQLYSYLHDSPYPMATDPEQETVWHLENQRLSTQISLASMIIILSFLILFTSLSYTTQTVIVEQPSVDIYSQLETQSYAKTLVCPCTSILNEYKNFISFQPTFHQICSSIFLSQQWLEYLDTNIAIYIKDFRANGLSFFPLLETFCNLSLETISTEMMNFNSTKYATKNLQSRDLFQSEAQQIATLFQQATRNSFLIRLAIFQQTMSSNALFSAMLTNYFYGFSNVTDSLNLVFHPSFYTPDNNDPNITCSCKFVPGACDQSSGIYDFIQGQNITYTVTINNPTVAQFNSLYQQYRELVQCPCTRLSVEYQNFISLQPTSLHSVCSSDFINTSSQWLTVDYPSVKGTYGFLTYVDTNIDDFRNIASPFFQAIYDLCQLSEQTINTKLLTFKSTAFITPNLIFNQQFNVQTNQFITQFIENTARSFTSTLLLNNNMTHANMLMSALSTDSILTQFPDYTYETLYYDYVYDYDKQDQIYNSSITGAECDCQRGACVQQAIVYDIQAKTPLFLIPGKFVCG